MKRILIAIFGLLISSVGYSQVTGYSFTIKSGPAINQVSVYLIPKGSGNVQWTQIEAVIGFTGAGAPVGTWATDGTVNSMFGSSYGAVPFNPGTSKNPAGYSYQTFTATLGSGAHPAPVEDGKEIMLGTVTYPDLTGKIPYLLDFNDQGSNYAGNTYVVEGTTGYYYEPSNYYNDPGIFPATFYAATGGGINNTGSQISIIPGTLNTGVTPSVTTLPLKLLSFNATKQSNSGLLNWTVSQQVNTASFTVERSTDGQSFNAIGTVAASGNDAGTKAYSYTDAKPISGTNYYRLKMVDIDGKYTYSPIKTLQFDALAVGLLVTPNPTPNTFYVKGLVKPAIVSVLDINGRYLSTQNGITSASPIDISSLPRAVYLVQVIQDSQLAGTFKLIKE